MPKKLDIPCSDLLPAFSGYYLIPENWQNLRESAPRTTIIRESQNLLDQHQTIYQKSERVLADYQQLRSVPQKYRQKQQETKEAKNFLLEKLHKAQKDLTNPNKLEAQTSSITDLQKLEEEVAQYKTEY